MKMEPDSRPCLQSSRGRVCVAGDGHGREGISPENCEGITDCGML